MKELWIIQFMLYKKKKKSFYFFFHWQFWCTRRPCHKKPFADGCWNWHGKKGNAKISRMAKKIMKNNKKRGGFYTKMKWMEFLKRISPPRSFFFILFLRYWIIEFPAVAFFDEFFIMNVFSTSISNELLADLTLEKAF